DATRYGVSVDVLGDDRSGPDHRAVSYSHSVQDPAAGADPDILADCDSFHRQRLRVHRYINASEAVIGGNNDGLRGDHRVAADREPSMAVEDTVWADVSVGRDLNAAAIGGEGDAVGKGDAVRDDNTSSERAAVGVRLDHRALGNVSGGSNPDPGRQVQPAHTDPMPNSRQERAFGCHRSSLVLLLLCPGRSER